MGKGSSPRPFSVSHATFAKNYDRIFAKRTPIELCKRGTDEIVAYACGKCGVVVSSPLAHGDRAYEIADEHCGPWTCEKCGSEKESRYVCRACLNEGYNAQHEKTLAEATDVTETYADMVSDNNDRFWPSPDDASDDVDEPTWLFACTEERGLKLDAFDILCSVLEDRHEDAIEEVDYGGLQKILDEWCAKQTIVTYWPDTTRKVLVKPWPDEEKEDGED